MEAYSWRQNALSKNLERLVETTENLSSKHEDHAHAIKEAKNMTSEILETLESVAGAAAMLEEADRSRWGSSGFGRYMPYIVSPAATLYFGSYGLAPSALRNLGLVALGEMVGFWVTNFDRITSPWSAKLALFDHVVPNNTVTAV